MIVRPRPRDLFVAVSVEIEHRREIDREAVDMPRLHGLARALGNKLPLPRNSAQTLQNGEVDVRNLDGALNNADEIGMNAG